MTASRMPTPSTPRSGMDTMATSGGTGRRPAADRPGARAGDPA
jgi:hypothetical protein